VARALVEVWLEGATEPAQILGSITMEVLLSLGLIAGLGIIADSFRTRMAVLYQLQQAERPGQ
jgi:hypothetical protein